MSDNSQIKNNAIGSALFEINSRYGSAGAEFLKGLFGIDHETGKIFDRSLLDISNYKVNPEYKDLNIKQQSGFSAENVSVSKRNSEAIINQSGVIAFRSEDLPEYGKNHNSVDIVQIMDDQQVTSQMKFVTNTDKLLTNIVEGNGKNDLSRYLDVDKLEVPTEQVEKMKGFCRNKVKSLTEQANRMELDGNTELAKKYRQQIENYKKLEGKITDSGLTTQEAIAYRNNPRWETTKDIAKVSHRAGIEGAKFGAAIGGSISLITNIIAICSGNKEFGDAALDTAKDTLISAGVGYGTAFVGTVIKTMLQQSESVVLRGVAKTGFPGMVVSLCLSTGKSITQYAKGDIDESRLMEEMGMSVSAMLSSSMFTMLGQVAIPIPILGGLIGGMIGYTLTNTFYHSFVDVLKQSHISKERRKMIEMKCDASKALALSYQNELKEKFKYKLKQLNFETKQLFSVIDDDNVSGDKFCLNINKFAEIFGEQLPIKSMAELDIVMLSNDTLKI